MNEVDEDLDEASRSPGIAGASAVATVNGSAPPADPTHPEYSLNALPGSAPDDSRPGPRGVPVALDLVDLWDRQEDYRAGRRSPATNAVYARDWARFVLWADGLGVATLPASGEVVALYVTALAAELHPSTIGRRLAAIAAAHAEAGHPSPTRDQRVVDVIAGVRRTLGVAPRRQVAPAVTAELRRMVQALPDDLSGTRDRALLLMGFAGAFRRSELVALDVADLTENDDGLVVNLRRSKTDQEGIGRQVGIPHGSRLETCPVRSMRAWLDRSAVEEGALWRPIDRHGRMRSTRLSAHAVALVVKRSAAAAGLDPERYAGHSLRAGLATSAAKAGATERAIMAQTGHRSVTTVRKYIRAGTLFEDNAAAQAGL